MQWLERQIRTRGGGGIHFGNAHFSKQCMNQRHTILWGHEPGVRMQGPPSHPAHCQESLGPGDWPGLATRSQALLLNGLPASVRGIHPSRAMLANRAPPSIGGQVALCGSSSKGWAMGQAL